MKTLLIILDGFGHRSKKSKNAIANANMQFLNKLIRKYPNSLLKASSENVGLPSNTMGNSEVGHLNIGAGRVVAQECVRINNAIQDKTFFDNKTIQDVFLKARKKGRSVHVLGLLSDASVHAHIDHLIALISLAKKNNTKTFLHIFTDGRDMKPKESTRLIKKLANEVKNAKNVTIATVSGRYYAMDRDKRWKRTKKAYDAIVSGKGIKAKSVITAVESAHKAKQTDEFIIPRVIDGYKGINNNDSVFSFNFRADRARQICYAFEKKDFVQFKCSSKNISLTTMTLYDQKGLVCPVAFPKNKLNNTLAQVLSRKNIKQTHIAETEKYAHVTYFFNGGIENKLKGEKHILIPSKKVATYDLVPAMSTSKITKETIKEIKKNTPFILVNFANPDMVSHTGNYKATRIALDILDKNLEKIVDCAKEYTIIITADHGNCEDMTAKWQTSHTLNKVPLILVSNKKYRLRAGSLCDIAPTILDLEGINKPKDMTGSSLLK